MKKRGDQVGQGEAGRHEEAGDQVGQGEAGRHEEGGGIR